MLKITTNCDQQHLAKHAPDLEVQVKRLAEHLKLGAELFLAPLEPRKGSGQTQGLRAQRYEPDDKRPAVLLLFHPASNDTCWLWRLQFPPATDIQLMYGRLQVAIERGHHLVDPKKLNGAATHSAEPNGLNDKAIEDAARGMEATVCQGEIADLLLVELRAGLTKGQSDFDDSYARSRLLRADSRFKGDAARVVLRAMRNRLLLNFNDDTKMYRFGARGVEMLRDIDDLEAEIRDEEAEKAAAEAARQRARVNATVGRLPQALATARAANAQSGQGSEWTDEESPSDRRASEQRVSQFMQKRENVALVMRYICSHGEWSSDAHPLLKRVRALDMIIQSAYNADMSRRDAGRLLSALVKREYFTYFGREEDVIQINSSGVDMARSCKEKVERPWAKVFVQEPKAPPKPVEPPKVVVREAPPPPPPAPTPVASPLPAMGADYIRDLTAKAAKTEAANALVTSADQRMSEIGTELTELETRVATLKAERDKLAIDLVEAKAVLADSEYIRATEELANIRELLKIK